MTDEEYNVEELKFKPRVTLNDFCRGWGNSLDGQDIMRRAGYDLINFNYLLAIPAILFKLEIEDLEIFIHSAYSTHPLSGQIAFRKVDDNIDVNKAKLSDIVGDSDVDEFIETLRYGHLISKFGKVTYEQKQE